MTLLDVLFVLYGEGYGTAVFGNGRFCLNSDIFSSSKLIHPLFQGHLTLKAGFSLVF
jgi:hypothetical protein